MLKVSYKSTYLLLEQFYQRRSLNQVVYGDDVAENVFEASKVFAQAAEDFNYLSVMVNKKDDLDKKYALFIDGIDFENLPIVLEKECDLTLLEFAIIAVKCPRIEVKLFQNVVEAQAEGKGNNAKDCIKAFLALVDFIKKGPDKNKATAP